MIFTRSCLMGIFVLLMLAAMAGGSRAGEYGCAGCIDSGSIAEQFLRDDYDPKKAEAAASANTGLSMPQLNRRDKWNKSVTGFEDGTSDTSKDAGPGTPGSNNSGQGSSRPERPASFASMLVPASGVSSSEVVLDVSENAAEHIEGAISIPYYEFLKEREDLRPESELSEILGANGISPKDSVVVYGESPSVESPALATYVYWILKYMGHDKVRVLDGGLSDWIAANLNTTAEVRIRPKTSYARGEKHELFATYDDVKSGKVRIVDARSPEVFNASHITGAINIPYETVIDGGKFKDEAGLKSAFKELKDEPVVVYTNASIKASVVWFGLKLLGYNASLYSFKDWTAHEPKSSAVG
jgi:thiosulfate/3-mercaptopyruvate sulfurtransferase